MEVPGVIASLDFDEMESYQYAVKKMRNATYFVCEATSNCLRILEWNQPIIESEVEILGLRQSAFPKLVLQ
ncbi:hypothetical protein [Neobacillus sp.]|uniref:hypothetical protein n=1 Tax=Neobacillus sp. TaxID=2675273 RepID=UPI0035B568AE